MKRNIILFLCAFLATLGVCAGVFMLLKYRANLQADEAAAQAAATAPAATPEPVPAPLIFRDLQGRSIPRERDVSARRYDASRLSGTPPYQP